MKKNYIISAFVLGIHLSIYIYLFSDYAKPMSHSFGFCLFGILLLVLIINLISYIRAWIRNKEKASWHKTFLRWLFLLVNIICLIPMLIMFVFNGLCL